MMGVGELLQAVVDRAIGRLLDRVDVYAVNYVRERDGLDPALGRVLLEKLAERYGAKLEIFEGPG
jgi:hypothetical protein